MQYYYNILYSNGGIAAWTHPYNTENDARRAAKRYIERSGRSPEGVTARITISTTPSPYANHEEWSVIDS